MPLTRRNLLAGAAALGATLILPPTLAENAEAARRYWALDRTMAGPPGWIMTPKFDASMSGVLLPMVQTYEVGRALMDEAMTVHEFRPVGSEPFRIRDPRPGRMW